MDIWNDYRARMGSKGITKREEFYNRQVHRLTHHASENLSYQEVTIDECKQNVTILDTDALNQKTIISLPNENLDLGEIVRWKNLYWLITERDANTTLYTKCKMTQCNYLLKWVTDDKLIHVQWCVIEDGTTYQTGERESSDFVVTRGDTRIAMYITRNEQTINLGRDNRFLIGDPDAKFKLAYTLSKPLKVGNVYNGHGVYQFVLQEVSTNEYDNHELAIADYYRYFPEKDDELQDQDIDLDKSSQSDTESDRKGWL